MTDIILTIIGVAVGALIVWFILAKGKNEKNEGGESLLMIQKQLESLRSAMDDKLTKSTTETMRVIQQQFGESAKIVRDVTERLTKLDETNKQVLNFSDQLKNLQDILKNPKQRGVLGEYYLETLLKNVMPPGSYQMQYDLGQDENGKKLIVDAIVRVKDKIIPIDSKFSLENYNRLVEERSEPEKDRLEKLFVNDLKMRIQETSKYIKPSAGTMDFAFMFIPHEAIYYDLLINKIGAITEETDNLIQRAANKYHVIIVSPTSFLAYLQTVLQGLRALQIEESAKEIRKKVEDLARHLNSYGDFMNKLGNNLGTTVNTYNKASKEFKKIDKDVLRITGEGIETEIPLIDKPEELV